MQTIVHPLGGETYMDVVDFQGNTVTLTYNDLWTMIVCRETLDGDWVRMRQVAGMVRHPLRKRLIVDRLGRLDQTLNGLPELPEHIVQMHLRHAHLWFNQLPVSNARNQ